MIVPCEGRVLVELIKNNKTGSSIVLPTESNKGVGENLQLCRIIHPGDSGFKEGQLVVLMEYSLAGVYKHPEHVVTGEATLTQMMEPENKYYLVSAYDIMATVDEE